MATPTAPDQMEGQKSSGWITSERIAPRWGYRYRTRTNLPEIDVLGGLYSAAETTELELPARDDSSSPPKH